MPNLFTQLYRNQQTKFSVEEENIYFQVLEAKWFEFQKLITTVEEKDLRTQYEVHHILPRHAGGTNEIENLMALTPQDHALAHYYRYCVTKDVKDLWVWNLRKNVDHSSFQTPTSRLALAREIFREHCRQEKKYFWDSVWQIEQARKGAAKGGAQNSLKQKNSRKKTGTLLGIQYGKQNGRIQGVKNQTSKTKEFLSYSYFFNHSFYRTFQTQPQNALIDLAEQCLLMENFQKSLPLNTEKRQIARQLGRLLREERKSYYGWSVERENFKKFKN